MRAAESKLGTSKALSEAVARYLFKLMAYKDEYEVARLHTDPAFLAKIEAMFEGDYKLVHHLAPPLTAKRNDKGELIKKAFGPWMRSAFGWLARLKGLRGGALDVFGRTAERKTEVRADRRIPRLHRRAAAARWTPPSCRWRPRSRASPKRSAATAT